MPSKYTPLRLNEQDDADILRALDGFADRSARLRQLIRIGIQAVIKEGPGVVTHSAPEAPDFGVTRRPIEDMPSKPAPSASKRLRVEGDRLPKHGDSVASELSVTQAVDKMIDKLDERFAAPAPGINPFGRPQPTPAEILAAKRREAREKFDKPEPGKG